jgi:Mrp family chromosome partitioning ATPase
VVVGTIGLAIGLALIISLLRPQDPRYAAYATVVIQEPITPETAGLPGASAAYLRSQLEILRSPLVTEAGLRVVTEDFEDLLNTEDSLPELTIIGSIESPLVEVEVIATSPDLAVAYANAIAEAYREVSQRQASSTSAAQIAHIDAQVESVDERLREIQQEVSEFVADDDDLAALQAQAAAAVTEIGDLQSTLVTSNLSEEEAAAIRQRIQDRRQVMAVYQEVLAATASHPELRALEEEQARQVDRRARLLTLRDEAAVNVGLVPDAIALVQPAEEAIQLPGTDVLRVLAAALLVGTAAGLGLAHLLTVSRKTFTNRTEPAAIIGATLLADIPDFEQEGLNTPVPVRDKPRSAAAEAFRFASATLEVAARGHSARSIFFASSTYGMGKTTTVVNTAVAAAANERSVLVLDCDFGNQEASRLLIGDHHGSLFGVTDIIEGQAMAKEATHEVTVPGGAVVRVMPRGTRPSLAAATLQSRDAHELFALLTSMYDLVIIDGPPMLQVAYASTLAGLSDAVAVVVENRSRQSELIDLKSRLDLVGTPILGYVYNRSLLRREMTKSEGSLMDILGDRGLIDESPVGPQRDSR